MSHAVFISYARCTSRKDAQALHAALEQAGTLAFLDSADIEPGETFPRTLTEAILDARVFVLFADPIYFTRWYCLRELRLALAAFETLAGHAGPEEQQEAALAHIVVALSPEVHDADLRRLPPAITQRSWPRADETEELAHLVAERLAQAPTNLRTRYEAARVPRPLLDAMVADARLPPPGDLGPIPHYPRDLLPSLDSDFIGRADELWQLDYHLSTRRGDPATTAPATVALTAGAGFGKTRLALEYLYRFGPIHFPGGLFWVDGARPLALLDEQLHGIWQRLDPRHHTRSLQELLKAGHNMRETLAAALDGAPAAKPILYVVDNVEEPSPDTPPRDLATWCPARGTVTVLVTSRSRAVGIALGISHLELDVLQANAAVALLTRGTSRDDVPPDLAKDLAVAVGHLPLALELLNAALRTGATAAELHARLIVTGSTRLLDDTMETLRDQLPVGSLRGVSETLLMSYDRLPEEVRQAARVLAFFAADAIPRPLVDAVVPAEHGAEIRSRLLNHSILTSAPLAEETPVPYLGRMHRVVADFLRARAGDTREDLHAALAALCAVIPVIPPEGAATPDQWPLMRTVIPHALAILSHLARYRARDPRNALLLDSLGQTLYTFGDKAGDNAAVVAAIAAYREALEQRIRDRVPLEWAETQHHLGNALAILGDREVGARHLEEAIATYRAALEERTRERVPLDWARTQAMLGQALLCLSEREGGAQRTRRLEDAVAAYRAALEECTRARAPLQWAATQNNLGSALLALSDREVGTKRLEEAIAAYRAALEERTRECAPFQWAGTQNNLGRALVDLGLREEGTQHLEEALAAFRAALKEFTRERVPLGWATIHRNLGDALCALGWREGGTQRFEEGVAAYRAALEECTRERATRDWAATQDHLGMALLLLAMREALGSTQNGGEEALVALATRGALCEREGVTQHLREAVSAFRAALDVFVGNEEIKLKLEGVEYILAQARNRRPRGIRKWWRFWRRPPS